MKSGTDIHYLKVGQSYSKEVVITSQRVEQFAQASGDFNPLHLDEEFAKSTRFGRRVAHGMLTLGIVSGIIGTEFPGHGTIYLSQDVKFLKPVFIDDILTINLEVKDLVVDKNRAILSTEVVNQREEKVATGTAVVLPPTGK